MTEIVQDLGEVFPGGLPPLSELLAWSTDHLIDEAMRLEETADLWEHTTTSMWRDVHTVGWSGAAADAAKAELTSLEADGQHGGACLRSTAQQARSGASDVLTAQNSLRYAVEDAQAAGFDVYDDYTVGDPTGEHDPQPFADAIYQRARELVGVDTHVGERMKREAGDLDGLFGEDDGKQPRIILMDQGGPLLSNGPLSPHRQAAVDYAEKWADSFNPAYQSQGGLYLL